MHKEEIREAVKAEESIIQVEEQCNQAKEVARQDDKVQFYAFPSRTKVEASDAAITNTILICDRMATVLFDLSST